MEIKNLLIEATKYINNQNLNESEIERLKDILCYLSEYRMNNLDYISMYPQLDFVLYNASRKMRIFGYNRLNNLTVESVDESNLSQLKDHIVDELYKTESGFILDKLQKDVLDEYENSNEKLFLSAPTSFGKTFLLKEIIYRKREKYNNIVIVLPTVALLMEVTNEIDTFNIENKLQYKIYNSIYKGLEIGNRNIFILTPERVLRLFAIIPNIKIDFFFFDEIYKIDEDMVNDSEYDTNINIDAKKEDRAIAFRLALYFLLKKSTSCYLAGPFISLKNLKNGFLKMLNIHNIHTKEIIFVPTLKRNIYFNGKDYEEKFPFGNYIEKTKKKSQLEKLIFIAEKLNFSKTNQAIVYCLYPSYTERYAKKFAEEYRSDLNSNDKTKLFVNHLKRNYNLSFGKNYNSIDNWNFLYSLENRVGIHNGKFPKYFQREIMNLFNLGELNTLFCTSTIVEGVNTNAKTVVVYNNPSGKTDESKKFLLLNINGRAGRYQHHFIGNIIYLNDQSVRLIECGGIELDFKSYNDCLILGDLELENIDDYDLSNKNKEKKIRLELNKNLLPDKVFEENRLIERKKQEKVLSIILNKIENFKGIENICFEDFISELYFENILNIWAEVNNIKTSKINAVKWFSINYAKKGYQGVLKYRFEKFSNNKDIIRFTNDTYRFVFRDVKDIIEYQIPRIICLFESLLNRAFEIKSLPLQKKINLSEVIKFFEIGAISPLGIDMAEKGIPIISVKKIENIIDRFDDLDTQRNNLKKIIDANQCDFDDYEMIYISSYINRYC